MALLVFFAVVLLGAPLLFSGSLQSDVLPDNPIFFLFSSLAFDVSAYPRIYEQAPASDCPADYFGTNCSHYFFWEHTYLPKQPEVESNAFFNDAEAVQFYNEVFRFQNVAPEECTGLSVLAMEGEYEWGFGSSVDYLVTNLIVGRYRHFVWVAPPSSTWKFATGDESFCPEHNWACFFLPFSSCDAIPESSFAFSYCQPLCHFVFFVSCDFSYC